MTLILGMVHKEVRLDPCASLTFPFNSIDAEQKHPAWGLNLPRTNSKKISKKNSVFNQTLDINIGF